LRSSETRNQLINISTVNGSKGSVGESLALRIDRAYQQVTDWHERIPPASGQ
jgi:hypothetical protein